MKPRKVQPQEKDNSNMTVKKKGKGALNYVITTVIYRSSQYYSYEKKLIDTP